MTLKAKKVAHLMYYDIFKKYQSPFTRVAAGPRILIALNTPEAIKEAFEKNNPAANGRSLAGFALVLDGVSPDQIHDPALKFRTGIIGSVGEVWRNTRKLAFMRLLSKVNIEKMHHLITNEIDAFVQYLDTKAKSGVTLSLNTDAPRCTLNIISSLGFGQRLDNWDQDTDKKDAISWILTIFEYGTPGNLEIAMPILTKLPSAKYHEFCRATVALRKFLQEVLDTRRAKRKTNSDEETCFLDTALNSVTEEEYNSIGDRGLVTLMLDFILAGTDTTSTATIYLIRQMLIEPELQKRVHAELDTVVGSREVTPSDLPNLPFLEAVCNEVLRLYPPAPFGVPHITTEDIQLGGYQIKAGWTLLANIYTVHRNPKVFPDPEKFDADRWLRDPALKNSDHFIPFSAGPRICVGRLLAQTEFKLIVAQLLHHFEWKVAGPIQMSDVTGISLVPHPFQASIRRRLEVQ